MRKVLSRSLAASLVAATPLAVARPAIGQDPPEDDGLSTPADGPIIWQGEVPGTTADAVVVVHARPTGSDEPEVGTELPIVIVGSAMKDEDGIFRVYGDPGTWYSEMADAEGRVSLIVTVLSANASEVGMSSVNVQYVTPPSGRGVDGEDGGWTVDEATSASGALNGFDENGIELSQPTTEFDLLADGDPEAPPPTSTFAIVPLPLEMRAPSTTASVPNPPGWYCTGPAIVRAYSPETWVQLGRYYHQEAGPTETVSYQSSRSTSTEWGFSLGFDTAFLKAAGRISFSTATTTGYSSSASAVPEGQKQRAEAKINAIYRLDELTECKEASPSYPSPIYPGGHSFAALVPQRWMAKVKYFRHDIGAVPAMSPSSPGVLYPLRGRESMSRFSGRASAVSQALEIGFSTGGKAFALTGSASVRTESRSEWQVSRTWANETNPSANVTKYFKGYGGDAILTGVSGVLGG